MNEYFGYRIDYFPLFNKRQIWDYPSTWIFFSDINDEITESKFRIDQNVRAVITAFRLALERNRWGIIRLKRAIQSLSTAALYSPVALTLMDMSFNRALFCVVAIIIAFVLFAYQKIRDSQLQTAVKSKAGMLGKRISNKVNNLKTNYTEYLAWVDREEKSNDMANDEWTSRSSWWIQLAMWNPKRIEYIEKFLQSEMQRTRIFMLRTGQLGRFLTLLIFLLPAILATNMMAVKFPFEFVDINLATIRDLKAWIGSPWTLLAFALITTGVLIPFSLQSSLRLSDISTALGKNPLGENARFADISLHTAIGNQIKRDKEYYRQRVLEGSYPPTAQKNPKSSLTNSEY